MGCFNITDHAESSGFRVFLERRRDGIDWVGEGLSFTFAYFFKNFGENLFVDGSYHFLHQQDPDCLRDKYLEENF